LASPAIFQSKPSDNSVGSSTENSPAVAVVCALARGGDNQHRRERDGRLRIIECSDGRIISRMAELPRRFDLRNRSSSR
jgi:hypothetical protein